MVYKNKQMQFNFQKGYEKKFLYFDTETTDIEQKEIIQLAFLTSDSKEFNMYFKPKGEIACKAMSVHHITPEMVEDKPYFEEAYFEAKKLSEYLNELAQEYVWVAHNVEFDLEVMKKVGVEIPNTICTFKLSRDLLSVDQMDGYDLESYSLQFLRYYLGLYKNENRLNNVAHDALSDVLFLRDLFEYLVKEFDLSLEKMLNITKAPLIIRNMHYGKHAGKSIRDIQREDPSYLSWIVDTWDDKPDLVWNVRRVLEEKRT